jgi:glycosyltransferase involved in cell wall biosynthesis
MVTYIPVFILVFYDWNNLKLPWLKPYPFPMTADIIVPVYNESNHIEEHLASVEKAIQAASETGMQFKIIVVDGGSTDNTVELIKKFDVRLIKSPAPGRGNQIAAGFASASGDIVIMLHADSIMHRDALLKLADKIQLNPTIGWGIFGHNYDKISLRMDKVRFMNRFRFKVMGIAFGDQGIFVRRDIMESQGGIPAIPLMEDVEISLRVAAFPRVSLGESLTLSARRWNNRTLFTYSFQVIYFVLWYLTGRKLGFNIQNISKRLYWQYYKK